MTVYVDDMRVHACINGMNRRWSHLVATDPVELRRFARRLGLAMAWIQSAGTPEEHFDVTDSVRAKAITLGAVKISYLDLPKVARGETPGRVPAGEIQLPPVLF
jgi:hypothetical protein